MVKPKKEKEHKDEGVSLDDAFADDEDVVYAESKPKAKKKEKEEKVEAISDERKKIKSSKPIDKITKGDKIKVDNRELEVDAVIVLMDHKVTKEIAVECFDPKADKDYQVRYFTGRLDVSDPEFYELVNDFMYVKRNYEKIEW